VDTQRPPFEAEVNEIVRQAELQTVQMIESRSAALVLGHNGIINIHTAFSGGSAYEGSVLTAKVDLDLRTTDSVSQEVIYVITCSFVAQYTLPDAAEGTFSPGALEAFASTSGMVAIYPYIREFVTATTARLGMTPIILPLFRIGLPDRTGGSSASSPAKA
jgi:hypothetical protein